jgi:hypothetical protein
LLNAVRVGSGNSGSDMSGDDSDYGYEYGDEDSKEMSKEEIDIIDPAIIR